MGENEVLTRAERDFLQVAIRSPDGNPWRLIGMSQRMGGAKSRMFDRMKGRGMFGSDNRLTPKGFALASNASPTKGHTP